MTVNRFLDIARKRRTQYALGNDIPIGQEQVTGLIQEAMRQAPSSFNSQSSRALILHGAQSVKFWEIVKDELRKIVPADAFPTTEKKIDSFAAGAGTVLFYEDQEPGASLPGSGRSPAPGRSGCRCPGRIGCGACGRYRGGG